MRTRMAGCVIAAALAVPVPAAAQIPVTDAANFLKAIEAAATRLRQLQEMIATARYTYQLATGQYGVSGYIDLISGPGAAVARRVIPADAMGSAMNVGQAASEYARVGVELARLQQQAAYTLGQPGYGNSPAGQALQMAMNKAAYASALGSAAGGNTEEQLRRVEQLGAAIRTAPDMKRINDLQAVIATHAVEVQVQNNQIAALALKMQAEREREQLLQGAVVAGHSNGGMFRNQPFVVPRYGQ